jgi:hypothetical protein
LISLIPTLEALEKTLSQYLALFDSLNDQADGILFQSLLDIFERFKFFLQLLEVLEMQIIHAAKGASEFCPVPPRQSVLFFTANLNVCLEWFDRIRPKIASGAEIIGNMSMELRSSYLDLLKKKSLPVCAEMTGLAPNCLRITNALRLSRDFDSLIGFHTATKDFVDEPTSKLIMVNALESDGSLETALSILTESEQVPDIEMLQGAQERRMIEILAKLNDWDKLYEKLSGISEEKISNYELQLLQRKLLSSGNNQRRSLNQYLTQLTGFLINSSKSFSENKSITESTLTSKLLTSGVSDTIVYLSSKYAENDENCNVSEVMNYISKLVLMGPPSYDCLLTILSIFTFIERNIDSSLRIGKSTPSQKIIDISLDGSNLFAWNLVYSFSIMANNRKGALRISDPDLLEVGSKLGNLARFKNNIELARRLLEFTDSNVTKSAALKSHFVSAKLLFKEKKLPNGYTTLLEVLNMPHFLENPYDLKLKAKSCIYLSQGKFSRMEKFDESELSKNLEKYTGITRSSFMAGAGSEDFTFWFLRHATELAPNYAKAWFIYGTYCYKFGKVLIDSLILPESQFFVQEKKSIETLANEENIDYLDIMKQFGEEMNDQTKSNPAKWKDALSIGFVGDVDKILSSITEEIQRYISFAVKAYFRFLSIFSSTHRTGRKKYTEESRSITATLRLLRILAKHCSLVETAFEECLPATPIFPWTHVIPQLFARLSHPRSFVQHKVKDLLIRIGKPFPQSIMYQSILGTEDQGLSGLDSIYMEILDQLMSENGTLVTEIRQWINELQRITILWEESWTSALEHIAREFQARLSKIHASEKRIMMNSSLANQEKKSIVENTIINMAKPLGFMFQSICDKTYKKSVSTPHEKYFFELFAEKCDKILSDIKGLKSTESMVQIKESINSLLAEISELTRNNTLRLANVSPFLRNLHAGRFYLPGLEIGVKTKLESCSDTINVLSSKTRPKRICLIGSDGKKYYFLLKGNEDLHLDERIQQFLKTANVFLSSDRESSSRNLNANTYNVVPFGNNYGMIQWVENLTGIYPLYRKRQLWEFSALAGLEKGNNGPKRQVPKPQEFFLNKLKLAQKAKKIDTKQPRQNWPPGPLKDIFEELKNETPKDIISSSFWCSSPNSESWWQITSQFSRSLAVTSMIGYILGLGDRHLDNILLDIQSGKILHIDFNICFEKGKRLRIPETVPFRLTQNLVHALGPNGIEGSFRIACEHTLRVMRENREIFLTLLEAFIYDPLVDWTKRAGTEKQLLNLNVSVGLLVSRLGTFYLTAEELKSTFQDDLLIFPVIISTALHSLADFKTLEIREMEIGSEIALLKNQKDGILSTTERLKNLLSETEAFLRNKLMEMATDAVSFREKFEIATGQFEMMFAKESLPTSIKLPVILDCHLKFKSVLEACSSNLRWYHDFMIDNQYLYMKDIFTGNYSSDMDFNQAFRDMRGFLNTLMATLYRTDPAYLNHHSHLMKICDSTLLQLLKLKEAASVNFELVNDMQSLPIPVPDTDMTLNAALLYLISEFIHVNESKDENLTRKLIGPVLEMFERLFNDLHEGDLFLDFDNLCDLFDFRYVSVNLFLRCLSQLERQGAIAIPKKVSNKLQKIIESDYIIYNLRNLIHEELPSLIVMALASRSPSVSQLRDDLIGISKLSQDCLRIESSTQKQATAGNIFKSFERICEKKGYDRKSRELLDSLSNMRSMITSTSKNGITETHQSHLICLQFFRVWLCLKLGNRNSNSKCRFQNAVVQVICS